MKKKMKTPTKLNVDSMTEAAKNGTASVDGRPPHDGNCSASPNTPPRSACPFGVSQHFKGALKNVANANGELLLSAPESEMLAEPSAAVVRVVAEIYVSRNVPPSIPVVKVLVPVGRAAFRTVTLIDPPWSAHLLALTMSIADDIERARPPTWERVVLSNRVSLHNPTGALFDAESGYSQFQDVVRTRAGAKCCVVEAAIANLFRSISSERLCRAMKTCTAQHDTVDRIMGVLAKVGPGLPEGAPASRLLAEAMLNVVDRALRARGISFARFLDEYRLFTATDRDAVRALETLASLLQDEGLALDTQKARIVFMCGRLDFNSGPALNELGELSKLVTSNSRGPDDRGAGEGGSAALGRFDVVAQLQTQLAQQTIDASGVVVVNAIHLADRAEQRKAVKLIAKNVERFYPIISNVLPALERLLPTLTRDAAWNVIFYVRWAVSNRSHVFGLPAHLACAAKLLGNDPNRESASVLHRMFVESTSPIVRREVIIAMGKHEATDWLRDLGRTAVVLACCEPNHFAAMGGNGGQPDEHADSEGAPC